VRNGKIVAGFATAGRRFVAVVRDDRYVIEEDDFQAQRKEAIAHHATRQEGGRIGFPARIAGSGEQLFAATKQNL
jgi:hypothetical protein